MHYRMECYYGEDFFSSRYPSIGNLLHRVQGLIEFDNELGHYPATLLGVSDNSPFGELIYTSSNTRFCVREINNIVLLAPFTFRYFVLE
jgi:hypothetical protein